MSFLAIDIGNTNITLAVAAGDAWRGPIRLETDSVRDVTACMAHLQRTLSALHTHVGEIECVGVASVVPPLDPLYEATVRELFGAAPHLVTMETYPHPIAYPIPAEIGADRLADAAGALKKYAPPVIIVDFGTATTFDYLDAQGAYCGGPIAPGVLLAQRALTEAAAKLPAIDFVAPTRVLPRTTVEAMQTGIFFGTVGAVNGLLERMYQEIGTRPTLIATGGLAPMIVPQLADRFYVEPLLTLEGIRAITVTGPADL
ncbi:MAG: type III pantothenate kinase [Deltaproteobacteria bacterium]|nr:type III pantothenate kinase [Deltaproteobacteria bacterium]